MNDLLTSSVQLLKFVSVLLLSAFPSIDVLASFKLSVLYAILEVQHTANHEWQNCHAYMWHFHLQLNLRVLHFQQVGKYCHHVYKHYSDSN